jgi:TonB-dependent starch-binding outer membrane protein SusC
MQRNLTLQLCGRLRQWLLVLPLVLFSVLAFAQNARITGKVIDDTGEGLPGVSVQVKGTATGTVTDIDGNYSISSSREGTLVFSYTGYGSQEVYVGNQTAINVTLAPSDNVLGEAVVVGYGTQSRRDITGAVAVVDVADMKKVVSSNFVDGIQGKVAGVQTSTSGDPGASVFVRIRGIGSINNNEPLYVIDGVPVSNETSLNFLNQSDIESIQVLKDASSASIYGARAANGVVVITTRKGRVGKSKITFDYTTGTQSATKSPDLCSPQELLELTILSAQGAGQEVTNPMYVKNADGTFSLPAFIARGPNGVLGGYPAGAPQVDPSNYFLTSDPLGDPNRNYLIQQANQQGTDWFGELFNSAPISTYQVAAQGGSEAGSYYISGNYFDHKGTMYLNDYKRYQTRVNTQFRVKNHVRVGQNLNVAYQTGRGGVGNPNEGSAILNAYRMPGLVPVRDIDGFYGGGYGTGSNAGNPIAQQERAFDNFGHSVRVFGSIYGEVDLLKYFTFKSLFGVDYNTGRSKNYGWRSFEATEVNAANTLNESQYTNTGWVYTNTLRFNKQLTDGINLEVLGGIESRRNAFIGFSGSGSRLDFGDDIQFRTINNVAAATRNITGYQGAATKLSQFGSLNANLYDKYLLTATVRRDGSSRFLNNRYGVFPGVSAGWRISNEDFLKGNRAITDMKVRAGWGVTGNDEAGSDHPGFSNFNPSIGTSSYDINGTGNSVIVGYEQTSSGNPDLKWETTRMLNFGLDFTLFNKLDVVAEWYNRKTSDMLAPLFQPYTAPTAGDLIVNIGDMTNTGVDLSLNYRGKVSKDFNYTVGVTFSQYTNEVTRLNANDNAFVRAGGSRIGDITYTTTGEPISQFYGYEVEGLWESWEQIYAAIDTTGGKSVGGIKPGRFRFRDLNNDKVINNLDETFIGSPIPDFFYGLNIGVTYKAFDLTVYGQGVQGNDIFNYVKYFSHTPAFQANYSREMLYEAGKSLPVLDASDGYSNQRSSFYVEDGSYFRLRNIQLGYTLPNNMLSRVGVDRLRLFVQAQNMLTFTKYSGLDPDVTVDNITEGYVKQRDFSLGIDRGRYPMTRSIIFGASLEF